jgi:hypothetical protein
MKWLMPAIACAILLASVMNTMNSLIDRREKSITRMTNLESTGGKSQAKPHPHLSRVCTEPQNSWRVTDRIPELYSMLAKHTPSASTIARRVKPRKLVVGMTFDCEEWMLEIKLGEIGWVVDHFVIVEGGFSLQNRPRQPCLPALLESNERISRWRDKIVYVYDTEPIPDFEYWEAEVHYRNLIGLRGLAGLGLSPDDLVIVTDMDEFPHGNFLYMLKWYEGFSTVINLHLQWSYYSFRWLNPKSMSVNAVLSVRELALVGNQTNRIRFDLGGQPNGWSTGDEALVGWHCSWCIPTPRFLDKMANFAHKELNQPQFRDLAWMEGVRTQGLWFPDSAPNGCLQQSALSLPVYVQDNKERFPVLLAPV